MFQIIFNQLTRLLKYSLSGNCRTVIIANICPSIQHYEETHNTLKYAWRAKQIRVSVERNVVDVKYHIGQYVQLIEELRAEITALKQQPQPPYPISKPAILAIAWDSIIQFAQHNCDHRVSIAALHKRLDDFKRIHQLNSFAADADLSSIIARTIEICTSSSSVDISDLLSAWIDEENNKESPPVKLAPAPPSPPVVQMSILSKQTAKPSSAKARRHSYLPRRSSMIPQITVVPPAAPLKLPAIVPGKLKGRKKRMSMIPLPRFNAETAQSRMSSIIPSTTSKAFTQQKQQQQQHPPSPPVLLQDEQELSDISKMLNNIDLLLDNLEVKTADEPEKCDSLADKSPNKLDFPSPLVKRTTMPSRPEIVEEKEDNDETPRPRRIVSSALRTVVDGRKTPENNPNIGNVVIRTACYSSTPVRRRNVWQDRFIPSTAIKPRQLNQSADIAKGQSGVQKMISATTPRTPNRQQPLIHSERELDQFIAEQVVNTPRALPK
jgi:hypothetical protein